MPETGHQHRPHSLREKLRAIQRFRLRRGQAIYGRANLQNMLRTAAMVDDKDSLAREIDEELRREQLLKLWEQYGTYVVAAAALLILAIGGHQYHEQHPPPAAHAARAR